MRIFGFFRRKEEKEKKPYIPFEVIQTDKGDHNSFLNSVSKKSLILLITGKRGSGKTALGFKFLEFFNKKTKKKCYAIGFEKAKLPRWIKKVKEMEDVQNNSVVLVDEGAVVYSARDAMKASNKFLTKTMATARHKNLSLILISQNSALVELNVLRLADVILLKEPSLLQAKFERKAIREMYEKVGPLFKKFERPEKLFYVWSDDFEGMLSFGLPEFWSESVSKAFK